MELIVVGSIWWNAILHFISLWCVPTIRILTKVTGHNKRVNEKCMIPHRNKASALWCPLSIDDWGRLQPMREYTYITRITTSLIGWVLSQPRWTSRSDHCCYSVDKTKHFYAIEFTLMICSFKKRFHLYDLLLRLCHFVNIQMLFWCQVLSSIELNQHSPLTVCETYSKL